MNAMREQKVNGNNSKPNTISKPLPSIYRIMKKSDRQKIFDKYGGKCAYCGCDLESGWHVDEIEPVRRNYSHEWVDDKQKGYGGKWVRKTTGCANPDGFHIDNQNPACPSCNINKHSDSLESFRKMIAHFVTTLNRDITQYKIAKRYGLIQETNIEVKFYFETFNQTT